VLDNLDGKGVGVGGGCLARRALLDNDGPAPAGGRRLHARRHGGGAVHDGDGARGWRLGRVGNAGAAAALEGDGWAVALRPLSGGPAARLGDLDTIDVHGRALQVVLPLPLVPAAATAAVATARAGRGQRSRCGRVVGVEGRQAGWSAAWEAAVDVSDGRVGADITGNARVGACGDGGAAIPVGVVVDGLDAHCDGWCCCLTYISRQAIRFLLQLFWLGMRKCRHAAGLAVSRPCRRRSSLLNDA